MTVAIGCHHQEPIAQGDSPTAIAPPADRPVKQFEVIEQPQLSESSNISIDAVGIVRYLGPKPVANGFISFNVFDGKGNRVGTANDMVTNIRIGETWKYKATCFTKEDEVEFALERLTFR